MYTGTLAAASNRADYGFHIGLTNPDTGTAIDLTGATIKMAIRSQGSNNPIISGTNSDGHIVVTAPATLGAFDVVLGKAELGVLCAGTYDFGMTILLNDGVTYQQMAMSLPVLDGVVSL